MTDELRIAAKRALILGTPDLEHHRTALVKALASDACSDVDISAPVLRVEAGNRVLVEQGTRVTPMTVVAVSEHDAVHFATGTPLAPWGIYLGRAVALLCDDERCECRNLDRPFLHAANECQLAIMSTVTVVQPSLFDF